jgi:hypothetical protein
MALVTDRAGNVYGPDGRSISGPNHDDDVRAAEAAHQASIAAGGKGISQHSRLPGSDTSGWQQAEVLGSDFKGARPTLG